MESQTQGQAGAAGADPGAHHGAGAEERADAGVHGNVDKFPLTAGEDAPVRGSEQFTALCDALTGKFCIAHDVTEFVDYRRRKPWSWERKKSWWEAEIERRENRRIRQMLGTGAGSYTYDEKTGQVKYLVVETVLQPHTPQEHDVFEATVKQYSGAVSATVSLSIEGGALKASFNVAVPELEAVVKEDGHAGVALKSDMDAKRAEEASRAEEARKATEQAQADAADAAAKSQELRNDELADVAAKAGAAAAAEVLKNAKLPAQASSIAPSVGAGEQAKQKQSD